MGLHEWGYEGEFLCCHGMSWTVQDFSVMKLPCPGIRERENPVFQSVRRPWDLRHSLRAALCERSEAHIHSNITTDFNCLSWIAVFTLHFTDFSRYLWPASSVAVGVSPRLCEPYAFHFANLYNRKICSSGECFVRKDGEPLRWSPKLRDKIVHCCFLLLVCPSVRSASFPEVAAVPLRCASCRLSDKAKWPMDTVLPFLCCQRKPNRIVDKPQLCTR